MVDKVDYEELLPHEFQARLAHRPVAYLPIGTLEWHGVQNALGADFLQSRGLFRRAAQRFGGIVLPPIWLGPDRITDQVQGPDLVGMDTADSTTPHRQLRNRLPTEATLRRGANRVISICSILSNRTTSPPCSRHSRPRITWAWESWVSGSPRNGSAIW